MITTTTDLADAEYFWQPVPDCWTVHADGGIDFAYPPPRPEPVTTIAWRLAHGPPASYETWTCAADAQTALRQLDDTHRDWIAGVRTLTPAALQTPIGPLEGPFADEPMLDLVLHVNREVIHHGAEIALLRDLYAPTETKEN